LNLSSGVARRLYPDSAIQGDQSSSSKYLEGCRYPFPRVIVGIEIMAAHLHTSRSLH